MADYYERDEVGEGPRFPSRGPRREAPAVCPVCGEDATEEPFNPTCGEMACWEAWVTRPRGTAQ